MKTTCVLFEVLMATCEDIKVTCPGSRDVRRMYEGDDSEGYLLKVNSSSKLCFPRLSTFVIGPRDPRECLKKRFMYVFRSIYVESSSYT